MYIAIYVTAIVLICAGAITFFIVKDQRNKKLAEKLKKQAKEEFEPVLNDDKNEENPADDEKFETKTEIASAKNESENLSQNQVGLEDFSLQFENEKKNSKKNFDLNPFSLGDSFAGNTDKSQNGEVDFDDFDFEDDNLDKNADENDDDLDKKFKEYEDFLRRNLDLDDEDLNDEEELSDEEELNDEEDLEDDDFLKDAEFKGNESYENFQPIPKLDRQKHYRETDDLRALQNFDYDTLKGKSEEEIAEIIKRLPPKAQEILMSDILARRKFEDEE